MKKYGLWYAKSLNCFCTNGTRLEFADLNAAYRYKETCVWRNDDFVYVREIEETIKQ
jgi:hypothetical protein